MKDSQKKMFEYGKSDINNSIYIKTKISKCIHGMRRCHWLRQQWLEWSLVGLALGSWCLCCCSVTQLCLTLCDPMDCSMPGFLRLPCPSPCPRAGSNSCPLRQWCRPTISSSVVPFSYLQSFLASRTFPMSRLFSSGGKNIGASASASVLPMNIQGWFL